MQKHLVVALAAALSVGSLTAGTSLADREIVVQPGENMMTISRRYYGDENHVWTITRANHLVSPDLIYAGLRLVLPDLQDDSTDPDLYAQSMGSDTANGPQGSRPGGAIVATPAPTVMPAPNVVTRAPSAAGGPPAPPMKLPLLSGPVSPDSAPAPSAQRTPNLVAIQSGLATWYGPGFVGGVTYCGEVYDQWAFTAASNSLPCGAVIVVTNQNTGQSVRVRITDRGGFGGNVILDLSRAAFLSIAPASSGVVPVTVFVAVP